jgi:hypothetical protein
MVDTHNISYKIDSNIWTIGISVLFILLFIQIDFNLKKRRKRIRLEVQNEIKKKLERLEMLSETTPLTFAGLQPKVKEEK